MVPVLGVDSTFVAVDYDADESYVYYSDVRKDTIMRVKTDGTGNKFKNIYVAELEIRV